MSPLDRRDTDDVIVDTDEDSMLSSEVPGKQNPLFIPIKSHSLAPAPFTALGQQRFKLQLPAAVAEPIPLHDLSLPQ